MIRCPTLRVHLLLLSSALLAGRFPAPVQAQKASVSVGTLAPEVALKSLEGGRVRLSGLRGRPVVVSFWATWCGPCRTEMPRIITAYAAHQGDGLEVLAIDLTDQEHRKDVERFVREFSIPFPVLLDQSGRSRRRYALVSVPTAFFVDAAGVVRVIHPGPLSDGALEQGLREILPSRRRTEMEATDAIHQR